MAFIDARTLPEGTEIAADLVIIGGGMAGIALAYEFAGANKRVAVIESGGRKPDQAVQDLYRGTASVGAPENAAEPFDRYLHESRIRALGGSGNVWGGKCVPLDESDFATRDWIPHSGWPMTRAQLQPFYDRACTLLDIAPFTRDFDRDPDPARPPLVINGARDFFSAPRWYSTVSGNRDRAKFDRFRTGFGDAPNIDVYLHANVIGMRRDRSGRALAGLDLACLNGRRHRATGRTYVLATGGIENARLLLASNIGNESDWVGRCFQGHVNYGVYEAADGRNSSIALSEPGRNMALYIDGPQGQCCPASTLAAQRRFRIPNFTVTIQNEASALPLDAQAITRLSGPLDQGGGAARNLACYFKTEQHPNRDSRIVLDPGNTDALGMPKVRLEWRFTAEDFNQLERAIDAFAAELGAAGLGRICWPARRDQLVALMTPARHHMGTTRMSVDPAEGVVDAESRVHGLTNLYIAGSSVFPTSGNANPTLTIIALTMRMADHLKRELGVRR